MAEFVSKVLRFLCRGLSLIFPPDALPEGKFPRLLNVRSYIEGTLHVREGTQAVATTGTSDPVHTVARLNDPTPFNGGVPSLRVVGVGTTLVAGSPSLGATLTTLASGFSGTPLAALSAQPIGTAQPWLYLADRAQQRKLNTLRQIFVTGIAPPLLSPTAALDDPRFTMIDAFEIAAGTNWVNAGAVAGGLGTVIRIDTTATVLLFDEGTTGNAVMALGSMVGVGTGTIVLVDNFEWTLIQDIKLAIVDTTIKAILYDDGVGPGLCTIQPEGNLSTATMRVAGSWFTRSPSGPTPRTAEPRGDTPLGSPGVVPPGRTAWPRGQVGVPPDIDPNEVAAMTRREAFIVDGLVLVGGEPVRILSIATGRDEVQSFRCRTTTVHAAGETLVGKPACRVYLESPYTAGVTVVSHALQNALTPAPGDVEHKAQIVGGAKSTVGFLPTVDLSKIGDRMTQPDDELHISLKIDKLDAVTEVRLYLDCDAAVNDYTRNVFFTVWEANDLQSAVQGVNAEATDPVVDAGRSTTVPRTPVRRPPGPVTTQLSLGNAQWMELRRRVKDLIRVGTDPTRTLRHVQGMQILVQADAQHGAITVSYDSLWIGGGFGPDVGAEEPPYVYTARYRSKATGATSSPSPISRGGVLPRRQRVLLTAPPSPDPQVDTIDYYRLGGTLPAEGGYLGSAPNTTAVFHDDFAHWAVDITDPPRFDEFQPWPTAEVPRSGRARVVGSALEWLSGDPFDPRWPPDMLIKVNGLPCTLYRQPPSATFLELHQCAGAFADAPFEIPGPQVLGTALPTLWGPYEGFYFSVGDPVNPGLLKWTVAHNPDVTRDSHSLYVVSPSTPLMNGFVWDNAAFVWSTDDLYRILPDFSRPNMFTTNITPCGRGLWNRWAWCLTPMGPVFLAKDGIYLTNAGAPAVSLTDKDLYGIFPHEGVPGMAINGVLPPDMSDTSQMRLGYADGYVYFDYVNAPGTDQTLVYDLKADRWFLDQYPVHATVHVGETGAGLHDVLLGRRNGTLAHYAHGTGDDGTAIPYLIRVPSADGGEPRTEKLVGDLALHCDPAGGSGITVTAGFDDFTRTEPSEVIGAGHTGRETYILDLNVGTGELAKNVGIEIQGSSTGVPSFYWWSAALIPKGEITEQRATDWDDAGYFGAKFMQGILLEADTTGDARTVQVQYDGGQVGATLTVIGTAGQLQSAHSFATPFIAHLLRLAPQGEGDWLHYRHRWIWEPSPELAAYWITQPTTHDFPGYGHVERVLIAHMSQVDFDLIVTADGKPETYRIPSSGNVFVKTEVLQRPNKGKVYSYALRTVDGSERMRIFLKDVEVRCKPWAHPDPYQILRPFGDLSREFGGARI